MKTWIPICISRIWNLIFLSQSELAKLEKKTLFDDCFLQESDTCNMVCLGIQLIFLILFTPDKIDAGSLFNQITENEI